MYKKQLFDYCVDGRVTNITELRLPGLIESNALNFLYFNKNLRCFASVRFETSDPKVDLYKLAVTFIKRLR